MTHLHLTPEAIARAKAEAEEREAERIAQARQTAQEARQTRSKPTATYWPAGRTRVGVAAQRRTARRHAEAWWQALRQWQTRPARELVPRTRTGSGGESAMRVVGVGNYGRGQAVLHYRQILTPAGWLSEAAVVALINESGSEHLERVRHERGLTTLLRAGGRFAKRGADAARDVLELAELLGDEQAANSLVVLAGVVA